MENIHALIFGVALYRALTNYVIDGYCSQNFFSYGKTYEEKLEIAQKCYDSWDKTKEFQEYARDWIIKKQFGEKK